MVSAIFRYVAGPKLSKVSILDTRAGADLDTHRAKLLAG
jgi:hypothetical protein